MGTKHFEAKCVKLLNTHTQILGVSSCRGTLPSLVDTLHLATHWLSQETLAYAEKGTLYRNALSLAKGVCIF